MWGQFFQPRRVRYYAAVTSNHPAIPANSTRTTTPRLGHGTPPRLRRSTRQPFSRVVERAGRQPHTRRCATCAGDRILSTSLAVRTADLQKQETVEITRGHVHRGRVPQLHRRIATWDLFRSSGVPGSRRRSSLALFRLWRFTVARLDKPLGGMQPRNPALGQRLRQVGDARRGHLGVTEV